MYLVRTTSDVHGLSADQSAVAQLLSRVEAMIRDDFKSGNADQANALIAEARELVTVFTERVREFNLDLSRENLAMTTKYLKLQSVLAIAIGKVVKHVSYHLRTHSVSLRQQRMS